MTTHTMHPPSFPYGRFYSELSYIKIDHYPHANPLNAVFIEMYDHDTKTKVLMELNQREFDKFIAEYITAHGVTWGLD